MAAPLGGVQVQDVVTRGGKMVFLYSRPGQRVLINSRGDMIVRPSWVEASLQRLPGGVHCPCCLPPPLLPPPRCCHRQGV